MKILNRLVAKSEKLSKKLGRIAFDTAKFVENGGNYDKESDVGTSKKLKEFLNATRQTASKSNKSRTNSCAIFGDYYCKMAEIQSDEVNVNKTTDNKTSICIKNPSLSIAYFDYLFNLFKVGHLKKNYYTKTK